jgi:hypothetical protein
VGPRFGLDAVKRKETQAVQPIARRGIQQFLVHISKLCGKELLWGPIRYVRNCV